MTIRPPLYGADTPQSFFDEDLEFGWNLRDLGCLLKQYPVPNIPGVTHPMTYFGMWKVGPERRTQSLFSLLVLEVCWGWWWGFDCCLMFLSLLALLAACGPEFVELYCHKIEKHAPDGTPFSKVEI